jgi:heat shock protein HslJ
MTSAVRLVRFTAALIAAVSLAACSGSIAGPSAVPAAPIAPLAIQTNTVWLLRSIAGADGPVHPIADPSLFTLMLTSSGQLVVRADCNRASGGYKISGSTLSIGPIASTRAYCTTTPVDQQFLMLLGGENVITVSDTALQLSSPRGTLRFGR